ncbi:MAG TPA: glycosyltransferase family 4 protein [Ideonella sp.]|nr:glycosyltransferase family 4 protein [Ideonella sp.]
MRIAFYAPLKSPTHGTPSGDRRVAGLLLDALALAGHRPEIVSTFRSYDGDGDAARQLALRAQGEALAQELAAQWRRAPAADRPQLWFTYHLYYKAPDWLGPRVAEALGIPYVIAEASHAAKRAHGPWALGHEASAEAIRRAALVLCPSRDDIAGVARIAEPRRIVHLPPFLEVAPYAAARARRAELRARIAQENGLRDDAPWIAAVAMMRAGDKFASYHDLAAALGRLGDLPWQLVVAGDGPVREDVEALFDERARFLGALSERGIAEVLAASDICAWPAVNEAYGMALLEAQAAGVPVVSCATRGVPDVVVDGRTGILVPPMDETAFADALRGLIVERERRQALGREAARYVAAERSLQAAAAQLGAALRAL